MDRKQTQKSLARFIQGKTEIEADKAIENENMTSVIHSCDKEHLLPTMNSVTMRSTRLLLSLIHLYLGTPNVEQT